MARLAHTYDCPDTNAIMVDYPKFTTFSTQESNDVIVKSTIHVKLPPLGASAGTAVFICWRFEVEDSLYNTYIWDDYNVASDANKATIKLAIKNHLKSYVRKITTSGDLIVDSYINPESGDIIKKSDEVVLSSISAKGQGELIE